MSGKILEMLTLEEKASLITGLDMWHTKNIDRLDINSIKMSDGPNGLRLQEGDQADNLGLFDSVKSTALPTGAGLASSWNRDLVKKAGNLLGKEARHHGVNVLLGPAVNIKRSPLGGRSFEYFSEDPVLTSELATEYIKGVQQNNVGTSIKHFAVNNQETRRMNVDVHVDERSLNEVYLKAFKKPITNGKPWTVMTAYNRVNGEYASNNKYLLNTLNKWGYDGTVISDWTAVDDIVKSIKAGLAIEMPGNQNISPLKVVDAVNSGKLKQEDLDKAVLSILRLLSKTKEPNSDTDFNMDKNVSLAEDIAAETLVLLKNDDHILPIEKNSLKDTLFIGNMFENIRYQGGGRGIMSILWSGF